MRPRWIPLSLSLFALFALFAPAAARADGDPMSEARKRFDEGVKRFQEGDFEGARSFFHRADALHHSPAITYNIARAEERLGHPQASVDAYEAYLAEAGDPNELSVAAALAIAQIKGRSPRVRVETDPPGAHIFVDGAPMREPSPATFLVTTGEHHVTVEGEGWRGESDLDAHVLSRVESVVIVRPKTDAAAAPPHAGASAPPIAPPPLDTKTPGPDDFFAGLSFALVPYFFQSGPQAKLSTMGMAAGAIVEGGYAITDRFEMMGRAIGAIGSEGVPFTSLYALGVALSYRAYPSLWLGAGLLGGKADTNNSGKANVYGTDYVFSPMAEVSVVVLDRRYGQWMVSALPSYFLAAPSDTPAFYLPLAFGLRGF